MHAAQDADGREHAQDEQDHDRADQRLCAAKAEFCSGAVSWLVAPR